MKLKNWIRSFLILFLIVPNFAAANKKNLLVLHSYNTGLGWTDNINRGIFESFKYENQRSVDIRCEYLDAKRYENQDYFACFEKFMKNKYAYVPIDAIISSDNASSNLLVK